MSIILKPTVTDAGNSETILQVPALIVATSTPVKLPPTVRELINDDRLYAIAKCESHWHQFDKYGKPLISPTGDVGIMQINQSHWAEAKRLGLDIFYSRIDNIKMAKIVLKQQGYSAWTCDALV